MKKEKRTFYRLYDNHKKNVTIFMNMLGKDNVFI